MRTRLLALAFSLVLTGNAFAADVFQAELKWPVDSVLYLTDKNDGRCPKGYFTSLLRIPGNAPVRNCWTTENNQIKIKSLRTREFYMIDPKAFQRITE